MNFMRSYLEMREKKSGKLLSGIRADPEFRRHILTNAGKIADYAAYLFETICEAHENHGIVARIKHSGNHYWGMSILGSVLEDAGLIKSRGKEAWPPYEPTKIGIGIYRKHKTH